MQYKNLDREGLIYELGATFEYQQRIAACMDKFRTIVKPRQAGMTTELAIEALVDAIIRENYVVCIVSPTARQSGRMMRYVKKAFRRLEKKMGMVIPTEKFTNEEIYFHHGSEIHSLPNNPLGVQGIDCDHAIVDEAGLFPQLEGEAMLDAIVGSLSAKAGRLTISGKPAGKRGMLWQYWDPTSPRYKEFTHFQLTWEDRAREDPIYDGEVRQHKNILTKLQFDETYNAMFIDEGVLIYPHALLEQAQALWRTKRFTAISSEGTPNSGGNLYIGIDFGRKRNLTEVCVLRKSEEGVMYPYMWKSMDNVNFEKQKEWIDGLIMRANPVSIRIDERGMGLGLLDYFVAKWGSRVEPLKLLGSQSKERVVLQLRHAFEDGKLAISPDDGELYIQLHSFQKEYTDHGNVRYFGKVDETDFKDDKVIALAAAIDAAQTQAWGFGIC